MIADRSFGIIVELALRGLAGGEHPAYDSGLSPCESSRCPRGDEQDDAERGTLLARRTSGSIRSVAFCVSDPGILKSLISLPWKAAFRADQCNDDADPGEDDTPGVARAAARPACERALVGDTQLLCETCSVVAS